MAFVALATSQHYMKTKAPAVLQPSANESFRFFACTVFLGILLSCAGNALGRPRPPLPPLPELFVLYHESFDWAYSYGLTNSQVTIAEYGTLRESWSGMALQRSGTVKPFFVPALDSNERVLVASHTQSAVRFWLSPDWVGRSLGGSGPGRDAVLCQLVAADGKEVAVAWSLQVTPDGSTLVLKGAADAGPVELLRADIAWSATAHCIGLNFGPGGTDLFVDGQWVAQGEGTLALPPRVAGLVFGSAWDGAACAEADLEEIYVFGGPLSEAAMAFHYGAYASQAALGPISDAEWEAKQEAAALAKAQREALLASGMMEMLLLGATSQCITNTPVYLTNVLSVLDTNLGWTVTFDIQGGTNGLLYDVFSTTNLAGNSITNSQWTWLERGPTCSTYQYTNQPAALAFYLLGTPQDSDGDGLTDAFEQLVSKTDSGDPDTDGDGLPDGWEIEHGMNPGLDESAQSSARFNYQYDAGGWLRVVSGARSQSITLDNEGNVLEVP